MRPTPAWALAAVTLGIVLVASSAGGYATYGAFSDTDVVAGTITVADSFPPAVVLGVDAVLDLSGTVDGLWHPMGSQGRWRLDSGGRGVATLSFEAVGGVLVATDRADLLDTVDAPSLGALDLDWTNGTAVDYTVLTVDGIEWVVFGVSAGNSSMAIAGPAPPRRGPAPGTVADPNTTSSDGDPRATGDHLTGNGTAEGQSGAVTTDPSGGTNGTVAPTNNASSDGNLTDGSLADNETVGPDTSGENETLADSTNTTATDGNRTVQNTTENATLTPEGTESVDGVEEGSTNDTQSADSTGDPTTPTGDSSEPDSGSSGGAEKDAVATEGTATTEPPA